jgi:heat shock protein HslJ
MKRGIVSLQRLLILGIAGLALVASPISAQRRARLLDTDWRLTHLEGKAVTLAGKQRAPNLLFKSGDARVTGFTGCNRLSGTYRLNRAEMTFSSLAVTKMACPEGMELESRFLKALEQVRTWKIIQTRLELSGAGGGVVAAFRAGAFKK